MKFLDEIKDKLLDMNPRVLEWDSFQVNGSHILTFRVKSGSGDLTDLTLVGSDCYNLKLWQESTKEDQEYTFPMGSGKEISEWKVIFDLVSLGVLVKPKRWTAHNRPPVVCKS